MLFLYRPRETWMPFGLPRGRTQQAQYNRQLQARFEATRQLPPPQPCDTRTQQELNSLFWLSRSQGKLTFTRPHSSQ